MAGVYFKHKVQSALGRFGYALVKLPARPASADRARPQLEAGLLRMLEGALNHVTKACIAGDIVDCGTGDTDILYGLAELLVRKGNTDRRLILFDTSMDSGHRAWKTMSLWGAHNQAPFQKTRAGNRYDEWEAQSLPDDLIATSYPAKNISVETRITNRAIESSLPKQTALLALTCDSHKANAMMLEKILPRLAKGAAIIVRNDSSAVSDHNVALQLLRRQLPQLNLTHAWDMYWTATA